MTKLLTARLPHILLGSRLYAWEEIELMGTSTRDWAHHGVVMTPDGNWLSGTPSGRHLQTSAPEGAALSPELDLIETHSISPDSDPTSHSLWIADPGRKRVDRGNHELDVIEGPGRVVRVSVDSLVLQELDRSTLPSGLRDWRPCDVAAHGRGDDGAVWVADGYGLSWVHKFDRDGRHVSSIDGSSSGIAFDNPHALAIDLRDEPSLVVADRKNRRLAWFTLDGQFIRQTPDGLLTSPSGIAFDQELLYVTELFGGLVALDRSDAVVFQTEITDEHFHPAWPNQSIDQGRNRPTLVPGTFRSPHGIAVADDGRIAVTEWVIGGRLVILTPVSDVDSGPAVR